MDRAEVDRAEPEGHRAKAPVSREAIIAAALAVIDGAGRQGGVESLTMRGLGKALGVDPMMVYRFFPNKAAVLDGVMGQIWNSIDLDRIDKSGQWPDVLASTMAELRLTLLKHPRAISIVGTRPATGADLLFLLEKILGILHGAGMPLTPGTADLLNALVNYTVGHVLAEAGDPVGGEAEQMNTALSPAAFPHLATVFGTGWQYNPVRQFDSAVRSMIDGRGW